MFSHYHEVRASLSGARTSMPDSEALRLEVFTGEAVKARDSQEYRQALIADIGLYLKSIKWYEAVILRCRMNPPGTQTMGWGAIVKVLNTASKPFPRYLKDRRHVSARYDDSICPRAEDHFRERGYLW